jgi:hypothetical protein
VERNRQLIKFEKYFFFEITDFAIGDGYVHGIDAWVGGGGGGGGFWLGTDEISHCLAGVEVVLALG